MHTETLKNISATTKKVVLGGALAAPLLMIGLVLLYYDIRIRKEAFDLQLLMGPPIENVSGDSPAAAAAPSV